MLFKKLYEEGGDMRIGGSHHRHHWHYCRIVNVVLHETSETFSAPDILGKDRMSLHDLGIKCRAKFRAEAKAAVRRKFLERLIAAERHPESKNENGNASSQV